MAETFILKGVLSGHKDGVTAIAAPSNKAGMLVSASRDKSIIVWDLQKSAADPPASESALTVPAGVPRRRLTGHSHLVQDVVLSSDSKFALSGSWDRDLRLWDLEKGCSTVRFVGHANDVLSVAFSADNRHIVSASRDRTIKLWNTIGDCKYTIKQEVDEDFHTCWVSCVRFIPGEKPTIVSGSWDARLKVWGLANCRLRRTLAGHAGYVSAVAVSPDGSLCASGGRDDKVLLWDLGDGRKLYSLEAKAVVRALSFCPTRYWLCAATQDTVKIWNLETKAVIQEIFPGPPTRNRRGFLKILHCTSLAWSFDGSTLFGGFSDNLIRVWEVRD